MHFSATTHDFLSILFTQTQGWSSLHIAANNGKVDLIETLINYTSEYEADLMLKDKVSYRRILCGDDPLPLSFKLQDGKSVLQIAEEKQYDYVIKLLTELMHTSTDSEMDITQKDNVCISKQLLHIIM